jgi:hypothetical protein
MRLSKLLWAYEKDMGIVCDTRRCTRQASQIVTWHVLDDCGDGTDRVFLMCAPCAKDTVDAYREKFVQLKAAVRQRDPPIPLECTSCGRRITRLSQLCKTQRLVYRLHVKT